MWGLATKNTENGLDIKASRIFVWGFRVSRDWRSPPYGSIRAIATTYRRHNHTSPYYSPAHNSRALPCTEDLGFGFLVRHAGL